MPLFKKSLSSDTGSLSESHRKVLRRCRMILIKDIDVADILEPLAQDEGFKQDVRDQIMSYPNKEQRVGVFLDRLETRGEKAFTLFMEALKETHKYLHSVLEETIRTIDEVDDARHRDRVAMSGDTVKKLLVSNNKRKTDYSQCSENSTDELELAYTEEGDEEYIECYSIPLRGKQQKEAWIKEDCSPQLDPPQDETTYTAAVKKDLIMKRIVKQDIPPSVKEPVGHCPIYIVDHDYIPPTKRTTASRTTSVRRARKEVLDPPQEEKNYEPPPVPPKPADLPPVGIIPQCVKPKKKLEESSPETEGKTQDSDVTEEKKDDVTKVSKTTEDIPKPPKPKVLPKPERSKSEPPGPKPPVSDVITPTDQSEEPLPVPPPVPLRNKCMKKEVLKVVRPLSHVSEESLDKVGQTSPAVTEKRCLPPVPSELDELNVPIEPGDDEEEEEGEEGEVVVKALVEEKSLNGKAKSEGETRSGVEPVTESKEPMADSKEPMAVEKEIRSLINGLDGDVTLESDNNAETYEPVSAGGVRPDSSPVSAGGVRPDSSPEVQETHFDDVSKTSGDSLDGNFVESSIKSSTDSGIDNFNTPSLPPPAAPTDTPPIGMPRSRTLPSLPPRSSPKFSSRAPPPLPRNTSEIQVLPQTDSSDNDSFYEDIDGDGLKSSRSNSYLDPLSYAKHFEKAMNAAIFNPVQINVSDLHATGRILVAQNHMVVAEVEEACLVTDKPEEGTDETDLYKAFRGTCLTYDKHGNACYIPVLDLRRHGDPEGEPWFYPIKISSRQASLFLSEEDQRGCFIVYKPLNAGKDVAYNLSVSRGEHNVVHYRILQNAHGDVKVEGHDHSFMNIRDLVEYFQRNKSQLATRLRRPLKEAQMPITPGYHYDAKWEINRSTISLSGTIIGTGEYGLVCAATYHRMPVAVKVLQKGDCTVHDEDDFMDEARVLMNLKHENILRFIGLSVSAKPYFLITEYVPKGNLRDCLRDGKVPADDIDFLFDVCIQIASGMFYLETQRYVIHRDLAARNCLVTDDKCIKIADFGRACFVVDDCFQGPKSEKIAVKWAAPEILTQGTYSSKSDVWAMGVVFWEIFSAGDRPYSSLSGEQTAIYVTEGGRLDKPPGCSPDIFAIMKSCWRDKPIERPSFASLFDKLKCKSSIYYGTVREKTNRPRDSGLAVFNCSTPAPSAQQLRNATRQRSVSNASIKAHKSQLEDSGMRSDASSRDDLLEVKRRENLSSSSEASLLSTMTGKDDLSRGDKIRKSLRKLVNPKVKRRGTNSLDSVSVAGGRMVYQ